MKLGDFEGKINELLDQQKLIINELTTNPNYTSLGIYSEMLEVDSILADVIKNIGEINERRNDTLNRILMYTSSAKVTDDKSEIEVEIRGRKTRKVIFNPILTNGQVIKVNFSGLGSELYKEHFAIVWDVKENREQVTVIPTYSFKNNTILKANLFNIGKVTTLCDYTGSETLVSVDQVTTISRKRIIQTKFNNRMAYLTSEQKNRIIDGFRAYWVGEETLFKHIAKTYKDHLPKFDDIKLSFDHMFRPLLKYKWVKINENQKLLKYSLYNDRDAGKNPIEYEIRFIKMKIEDTKKRKELLERLAYHKGTELITRSQAMTSALNCILQELKEIS